MKCKMKLVHSGYNLLSFQCQYFGQHTHTINVVGARGYVVITRKDFWGTK